MRSHLPGRLFLSVGSLDTEFGPNVDAFSAELRRRDYQGLHIDTAELSGYGHASAAPLGFLTGSLESSPNSASSTSTGRLDTLFVALSGW